jgi:hypothetical protein
MQNYISKPTINNLCITFWRTMPDSERKLAIIAGFLFFLAGLLDLLRLLEL